jgi:apolipoprotein N-acyltransferase
MENQVIPAPHPQPAPAFRDAAVVAPTRPPSPAWLYPLTGVAGGLLLYACHFPLAWGWLGWVALVPLLCLVRTRLRGWKVYASAWLGGLVFFWPVLYWMSVADVRMIYTWAALASYCSLYVPLGIFLVRRLDRVTRLPLVLTVPVVWTALEFTRAHLMTGFAWYLLGYTQQAFLPVIQVADLAGVYAVTFLVASVNALVFELLFTRPAFRRFFSLPEQPRWAARWAVPVQAVAVVVLVGGALGYGFWRLGQSAFDPGPSIALVQGNVDQRIRNEASQPDRQTDAPQQMWQHFDALSRQAAAQHPRPDLIVWPETSYPYPWGELADDFPEEALPRPFAELRQRIRDRLGRDPRDWRRVAPYWVDAPAFLRVKPYATDVLLGVNSEVLLTPERRRRYNSAVLIQRDGRYAGRYDKIHRVPFGEYVPLRDWLPWMQTFAPYDFDYSIAVGQHMTRFPLGPYTFGVVICFEDTDPDLARQYGVAAAGQPAADLLVNISNDGWFDGSSEHEEHLAICRFRAVEARRSVARAVNMGISAVIDGNGRVIALPEPTWKESKKVAAVLTAAVPLDRRTSLYARWGDWLCWSCWGVLSVALLWTSFRRGPRRPAAPVQV